MPFVCRMLVVAQVVLAVQLPFTLIPLIKATSSDRIMGRFASSPFLSGLSWTCCGIIFAANLLMLGDMLLPGTSDTKQGLGEWGVEFSWWLEAATQLALAMPMRFLLTCAMITFASASLALLMWMLVNPVQVKGLDRSSPSGKWPLSPVAFDTKEDEAGPNRCVKCSRPAGQFMLIVAECCYWFPDNQRTAYVEIVRCDLIPLCRQLL